MNTILLTRRPRPWAGSVLLLPFCLYALFGVEPLALMADAHRLLGALGHLLLGGLGPRTGSVVAFVMPLLVPLALAVGFGRSGSGFGVQVFACWLGQNFLLTSQQMVGGLSDLTLALGVIALGGALLTPILFLRWEPLVVSVPEGQQPRLA